MYKYVFSLLPLLLPTLAFGAEAVTPEQLQNIYDQQRRADNLAIDDLDLNNYHRAKARAWLDLAESEYHEKDTSGTVTAALSQATGLLDAVESQQATISMNTPHIKGSEVIPTDLGDKIATWKKHEFFSCGQRPLATAEVYLVWAGHEFSEYGQSHADSYLRSVDNLIYDAKVAIENCAGMTDTDTPTSERVTLSGDALFAFNKATLNPSAIWQLNKLADNIKQVDNLLEVTLVGHTDRLRSDGKEERNQQLSLDRARSIRTFLIKKGIPSEKIHASGAGSSQPLVECSSKQSKKKQIVCLQPNRRVEITITGAK